MFSTNLFWFHAASTKCDDTSFVHHGPLVDWRQTTETTWHQWIFVTPAASTATKLFEHDVVAKMDTTGGPISRPESWGSCQRKQVGCIDPSISNEWCWFVYIAIVDPAVAWPTWHEQCADHCIPRSCDSNQQTTGHDQRSEACGFASFFSWASIISIIWRTNQLEQVPDSGDHLSHRNAGDPRPLSHSGENSESSARFTDNRMDELWRFSPSWSYDWTFQFSTEKPCFAVVDEWQFQLMIASSYNGPCSVWQSSALCIATQHHHSGVWFRFWLGNRVWFGCFVTHSVLQTYSYLHQFPNGMNDAWFASLWHFSQWLCMMQGSINMRGLAYFALLAERIYFDNFAGSNGPRCLLEWLPLWQPSVVQIHWWNWLSHRTSGSLRIDTNQDSRTTRNRTGKEPFGKRPA